MVNRGGASSQAVLIDAAVERLELGELVAFPTETVYGLGGDARNAVAVERIFAQKGRPRDHPLIVHVGRGSDLGHWARLVPGAAQTLIEQFWPGPLTLVLARARSVLAEVTGGQDTVALRCPDHPIATALLDRYLERHPDGGLAAPSANRFGRVSPTSAAHVRAEFGEDVMILDGGECELGIESTILDLSRIEESKVVLLRPGSISAGQISEVLGREVGVADGAAPRTSGMLKAHYAPVAQLRLVSREELFQVPSRHGVWSYSLTALPGHAAWIQAPPNPIDYAHALYATLRQFDAAGLAEVWIEAPPGEPSWAAVMDRLSRAVAGSGQKGS